MSNQKRDYDSTVARIAGNLLSGVMGYGIANGSCHIDAIYIKEAVRAARAIVAECKRTEPKGAHDAAQE